MDELRTQVAEMQRQYQLMLEMQQNQVFREREERLRSQLTGKPATTEQAPSPTQSRPMPAGLSAPAQQLPNALSPDNSTFDRYSRGQASNDPPAQRPATESGFMRLSNIFR